MSDASPSSAALIRQAVDAGVTNPRILDAMGAVAREQFVPDGFRSEAAFNGPIPIGYGQTTSQPSLVAMMIEALGVNQADVVLEVGTGYGYQAAVLAQLVDRVVTIERIPELAEVAAGNLERAGITNVSVLAGDGTLGAPHHAPFGGIVVAAAFGSVPPPLVDQLLPGRRLVQPVTNERSDAVQIYRREEEGIVSVGQLCEARFVPLIGEYGHSH